MPKQVIMFITSALLLRSLPFVMEGFRAEIPKRHITCNTSFAGTTAFVTCNFNKDMNTDKRPISVVRYQKATFIDDPGKDVLLCQWQDTEQHYKCELTKGFSIDGKITDHLRLKLPADTANFTGLYSCFVINSKETHPNACELTVEDVGVMSTTQKMDGTQFPQDKGKSSLLLLIILPVLLIVVIGAVVVAVIFYKCRRARNHTSNGGGSEVSLLMSGNSKGVSPEPNNSAPKDVEDVEPSTDLQAVMDLVNQELTASLRWHTGTSLLTSVASVQALPTESAKGDFLVVEFTSTTLKVDLVRLQDSNSERMSKSYEIPEVIKLGQGRELFDTIAKKVDAFVTAYQLFKKKFRLVFMLSFACEYDPDFSNARLTKWTRGFRCDDVVHKNLKELLQEALERNKLLATISVVTVTNDTVGLLMSVAYKDPSCRIALSLMDGFRACYLQTHDSHIQTFQKVTTTHLGALAENVFSFQSDRDRRLDESTIDPREHTMEKMTSVVYLGEMVRLELVQQMETGRLCGSSPRNQNSSKLHDKNSFSADDVSLIESDTDGYLITKHVLRKLEVDNYTEEDCQAVRSVCKAVIKRAADFAAAGLAQLINHFDHPDSAVAIEGHFQKYHPGFLNQVDKRTRELVKPQLKFKLVPSLEGNSKGAALLAAAVAPK